VIAHASMHAVAASEWHVTHAQVEWKDTQAWRSSVVRSWPLITDDAWVWLRRVYISVVVRICKKERAKMKEGNEHANLKNLGAFRGEHLF
jgi:hypothetical protein